jgi:hypothetical protein
MSEVLIESNIPPNPIDLAENRHFRFSLEGADFSIKPKSMRGLIDYDDDVRHMLILMLHKEFKIDEIAKMMVPTKDDFEPDPHKIAIVKRKLERAKSTIAFLLKLLEPVPFWVILRLCWKHNLKYWFSPKNWVFCLKQWFEWYLPDHDVGGNGLLDLLSWVYRYSEGEKKKIFQILHEGTGSITKDQKAQNGTKSHSTDAGWRPDSRSLGMMMLGQRAA